MPAPSCGVTIIFMHMTEMVERTLLKFQRIQRIIAGGCQITPCCKDEENIYPHIRFVILIRYPNVCGLIFSGVTSNISSNHVRIFSLSSTLVIYGKI